MSITVSLVGTERRDMALRLLFARFPLEEQATRIEEALKSAEQGCIDLTGLILAMENEAAAGAALMMKQADGIALVWPPVISDQSTDPVRVEQALMTRLCAEIEKSGAKLAQCLINPNDLSEGELLRGYGFVHSTDLFFMARHVMPEEPLEQDAEGGPELENLQHEPFGIDNTNRFAATIEQTYRQSLDCQFLNGLRTGADALASHQLSGQFDPRFWRLYSIGSSDVGVLMMNPHPDQNGIELVYLGVTPEFRGRGLGKRMLAEGIRAAAEADQRMMFLAVDCGNAYANDLYSQFGFVELARRRVLVRPSADVARK